MNRYEFFVRRNWTSTGNITIEAKNEEEADKKIEKVLDFLDIRLKNPDGSDFNHLQQRVGIFCGLYDSHYESDLSTVFTKDETKNLKEQIEFGFDIIDSDDFDNGINMDHTYYELEKVITPKKFKNYEEQYSKHLENQQDYHSGNPSMEGDNTKTFARMWDEEI